MVGSSIELNKDEVQIYGFRIKIDDIPYFLEHCKVPEHDLRFLIKTATERNLDKDSLSLLWSYVSQHQELSEEFMNEFAPYLNWYYVSEYQKLSPEFVIKHLDKITEEIFRNSCYESYPDTLKLLLQQKFGQSQPKQSNYSIITWSNQELSTGRVKYEWDVFGNRSIVIMAQKRPNIVVRTILRILLGSEWRLATPIHK